MADALLMDRMFQRIMRGLVDTGRAPHYAELARALGLGGEEGRLLLHDVIVVDQPLGRRGDVSLLPNGHGDGAIRSEEHPVVVAEPRRQPSTGPRLQCDALGDREAVGMLLEALDAEELRANRLFGLSRGCRRRACQAGKDCKLQVCLSTREARRCRSWSIV